MTADHYGWKAQVYEDSRGFLMDSVRVALHRPAPDNCRDLVIGFDRDTGEPITETVPNGMTPTHGGLLVDRYALDALSEQLKPGPTIGEVRRLTEALEIERGRVDAILGGVPLATPPTPLVLAVDTATTEWETAGGRVGHGAGVVVVNPLRGPLTPDEARRLALALLRQADNAERAS